MKQLLPFSKSSGLDLRAVKRYGQHSFFLESGKEIFDAQSGNGAFPLGFNRPDLVQYVASQVAQVPFVRANNSTTSEAILELNDRFEKLSKGKFSHVFYGLSGSDAIETSMKMAIAYWKAKGHSKKNKFISFLHGYHGSTFASSSATGIKNFHRPFRNTLPLAWTVHVNQARWFGQASQKEIDELETKSIAELEQLIESEGADQFAAVIKEPFSWQSGVHPPSQAYFKQLRALCDRHQILLIVDDVCTGAGKLGTYFGSEWMGIDCDINCTAKGISGGFFPLSATFCSEEVGTVLYDTHFIHGWTYSPSMSGVFSALKSIEIIESSNYVARAKQIESKVAQCAQRLLDSGAILGYRANGVFCGMDIESELAKNKVELILWDHGIQLSCYRFDPVLRTILPLSIADAEIEWLFDRLQFVLLQELAAVSA